MADKHLNMRDVQTHNVQNKKQIVSKISNDDVIKKYVTENQKNKQKLADTLTKSQLSDLILKQSTLLRQQSRQIHDIVNIANNVEKEARFAESQNCVISQKQNELCNQATNIQKHQVSVYEKSIKIQIVLFALFILVLMWLLYHYVSPHVDVTEYKSMDLD